MRKMYVVGDLSNGDFARFSDVKEAVEFYYDSIKEGTLDNIQYIGEDGCPWENEEECEKAANEFFYIKEVKLDENDEIVDETFDFIY